RVMPKLVLDGRVARAFRWSFNFGYYWRDDAKYTMLPTALANVVGDEVRVGIELGYTTQNNRFNIGPEVWFSSHALNDKFFHKEFTSLEILASVHYLIADMFRIGFGLGGAAQQDIGTPQMRAMFRFAYAPLRARPAPRRTRTATASTTTRMPARIRRLARTRIRPRRAARRSTATATASS